MPVAPNAIDKPEPILPLLAPARPLPASWEKPASNRPRTGDAQAPLALAFFRSAAAEVRGVIGSTATVGGNAARIAAPGVYGMAGRAGQYNQRAALDAIGSRGARIDAKA